MARILVIADDFTGAAEMGGVAHLFGLSTRIITDFSGPYPWSEEVIILDTHSRHLDPVAASGKIENMLAPVGLSGIEMIYKKVDSVLRGPVESEIKAVMFFAGKEKAVLIPANPSRGRTIRNGKYYIDGVPIDQTDFINDPEYPRTSARVERMVSDASEIQTMGKFEPARIRNRIIIPDVYLPGHFKDIIVKISGNIFLPAGGADFFRALLQQKLKLSGVGNYTYHPPKGRTHIILGSICEQSSRIISELQKQGFSSFILPENALTQEKELARWVNGIMEAVKSGREVIIARPENKISDPSKILNITSIISKATLQLIEYITPDDELFIEGGETASTLFRNMGNMTLRVQEVIADGTVKLALAEADICITVKPGSYIWPERIIFSGAN